MIKRNKKSMQKCKANYIGATWFVAFGVVHSCM